MNFKSIVIFIKLLTSVVLLRTFGSSDKYDAIFVNVTFVTASNGILSTVLRVGIFGWW